MSRPSEWSSLGSNNGDNKTQFATRQAMANRRHVLQDFRVSFSGATTKLLTLYEAVDNQSFAKGTIAIDAVPEKYKTTTTMWYTIDGVSYEKTAVTAQVFSAAHVVTASKFGIILLQIDSAGAITTKVPAATPTTAMAYETANAALAALPSPDSARAYFGYILIGAKAATWTANTDDMTPASDLTSVVFGDAAEGTIKHTEYVVQTASLGDNSDGIRFGRAKSIVAVLAASGTGAMIGLCSLFGYSTGG